MKHEWVISRVFQKSISSSGSTAGSTVSSSASGSKKTTRMSSSVHMSLYPEPSSPSSVYLPPLLDSSPYPTSAANDRDSCSYDGSTTPKVHVSCFSTFSASTAANRHLPNASFDLAPPPSTVPTSVSLDPFARFQRNVGVSAFPSLRSLQDNLQLPFFFPPAAVHGGSGGDMNGCSWTMPEEQTVADGGSGMALCTSELDYMWGY